MSIGLDSIILIGDDLQLTTCVIEKRVDDEEDAVIVHCVIMDSNIHSPNQSKHTHTQTMPKKDHVKSAGVWGSPGYLRVIRPPVSNIFMLVLLPLQCVFAPGNAGAIPVGNNKLR